MEEGDDFVDIYALLQIDPSCERSMVEKAYRHLAQLYHPDHTDTADVDKFQEVTLAYKILRDEKQRAEYDRRYEEVMGHKPAAASRRDDIIIDGSSAIEDAEAHEIILLALYKRRRERADQPGVLPYRIQQELGCSDDSFEFHVWYLKSKRLIDITEHGTLAITIEGVDQVISMSRKTTAELRLIAQGTRTEE